VTIHSFNDVLRAPKSIHSVELTPGGGTKIPLWRPVPWIGFLYFAVVEVLFIIAGKLPVLNVFSEMFAPFVYYVVFPIGVVWLVLHVELDGRSPHRWLISYLMFLRRPKRTVGGRAVGHADTTVSYSGKVRIWWDLHAPSLKHGWIKGGSVTTSVPVRFTHSILHRHPVMTSTNTHGAVVNHVVHKLEVRP